MGADPLNCVWLDTREDRTERVVLTANTDHWNRERGPRLEKVVFRNDISPAEALELVCTTEGEIDIVSEVPPSEAGRVENSEHARLEVIDSMRVVMGLINRGAEDVPLDDARARKALNLASDASRVVEKVFHGYAHVSSGIIPHFAGGFPGLDRTRTTRTRRSGSCGRRAGRRVGPSSSPRRPRRRGSRRSWPTTTARRWA